MNSNTRRSERLRRKRQSTPGLTQPGAYSLYGSGYVVESEASFLPTPAIPQTPKSAQRRQRYKDLSHRFPEETSIPTDQPSTPNPAASKARLSLFDILGSAARRPVSTGLHATAPPRQEEDKDNEEQFVIDDDPDQPAPATAPRLPGRTRLRRRPATPQRIPPYPRAPLIALAIAALLFSTLAMVFTLEATVCVRGLPYFRRAGRKPMWHLVRDRSYLPSLPSMPALPSGPAIHRPTLPSFGRVRTVLRQWAESFFSIIRYLLRRPWVAPDVNPGVGYVSRAELESTILPAIRAEARKTAAEEAARVTRELSPAPAARGSGDFNAFAERYAADKGLPPDYALLSVGASVDTSEPSVGWLYARFVRQYFEALVTEGAFTPLLPRRPQVALTPDVMPGNCWAFPGEKGSMTIRLARAVRPTSVTMEHTPKRSVFSTLSAPRKFRVLGVPLNASRAAVAQGEMVMLGEFVFDLSDDTRHLQSFVLGEGEKVDEMRAVRIEILSNHGAAHTALYRIRVHGNEVEK